MKHQLQTIRCIPLESCAKCPYSVGRQTCSKAQRDFEGGRPAVPPDWCPLPALHSPPAQHAAIERKDALLRKCLKHVASNITRDGCEAEELYDAIKEELQ